MTLTTKHFIAIVGLAGALTVAGGIARAAVPADDGTISACYSTEGNKAKPAGVLRVVDAATSCGRDERALAWNQRGPSGPSAIRAIDAVVAPGAAVVLATVGGVDLIGLCQRDPNSIASTPIAQLSIGEGIVPVDATVTGTSSTDDGVVESNGQPIVAPMTGRYLDGLARTAANPFGHFTLRLVRFDGATCRIHGIAIQS